MLKEDSSSLKHKVVRFLNADVSKWKNTREYRQEWRRMFTVFGPGTNSCFNMLAFCYPTEMKKLVPQYFWWFHFKMMERRSLRDIFGLYKIYISQDSEFLQLNFFSKTSHKKMFLSGKSCLMSNPAELIMRAVSLSQYFHEFLDTVDIVDLQTTLCSSTYACIHIQEILG